MTGTKADIISRLQRDILPLQGFRASLCKARVDTGIGPITHAFPNDVFPLGAIHEFISEGAEARASTIGFIAAMLASLMRGNGAAAWISCNRQIFPPALRLFDIEPDKILFIDLKKEKEILWVMEEALRCDSLCAVIGEVQELNFTASRRLQLAVEQSQVTGFILRNNSQSLNTTASLTRWKITALPSALPGDMPGVGFPRWKVELLKVRNGKPGTWKVEFADGRFRHIPEIVAIPLVQQKKTG